MRILIAEDERITRTLLSRQLQSWGHEVVATQDGEEAWDAFSSASPSLPFDIVITDWEMPRLLGVDFIKRLREKPSANYVYVIMLTSRSDKSDIVQGIEAGADDFVSKPFDKEELRVRLLAGERIVRLERTLQQQNEDLRRANDRVRHGLMAAARVQQSMLPKRNIVTPQVKTAWKYVPSEELAGDAVGLHLIDDRYLVAYVLDVSGHGVPAALLSVSAMHVLEPSLETASVLRDMNRSGEVGSVQHPARVAAELNRRFRAGENDGRYFTLILCVLDTFDGRLHFSSAGHPAPLLLRNGEFVEVPDAGGFPIAIVDDAEYEQGVLQLQPGDRLCLVSDGVLEQMDASDEQFGEARLRAFLCERADRSVEECVEQSVQTLAGFAGTTSFMDDVSLMLVDWVGGATRS